MLQNVIIDEKNLHFVSERVKGWNLMQKFRPGLKNGYFRL